MKGNLIGLLLVVGGGLVIFLAITGRYRQVWAALRSGSGLFAQSEPGPPGGGETTTGGVQLPGHFHGGPS